MNYKSNRPALDPTFRSTGSLRARRPHLSKGRLFRKPLDCAIRPAKTDRRPWHPDAGAERIGLLRIRFGQPVHRLDRAQDIDMSWQRARKPRVVPKSAPTREITSGCSREAPGDRLLRPGPADQIVSEQCRRAADQERSVVQGLLAVTAGNRFRGRRHSARVQLPLRLRKPKTTIIFVVHDP